MRREKINVLNIYVTVRNLSVADNFIFAKATEEPFEHFFVALALTICLDRPPEASEQLKMDLSPNAIAFGLRQKSKKTGEALVGVQPDVLLRVTPIPLDGVGFTVEFGREDDLDTVEFSEFLEFADLK